MISPRIKPGTDPESVFITVVNADGTELEPGKCVVWFLGTNATQPNGASVELPDAAINVTTGLGSPVAGVVHTTIATAAIGLIQVYGRDTVRSSASLASARMVVTGTNNATNKGHVDLASQSTLTSPEYAGAVVGWTIDNSANATNAIVMLRLL